MEYLRFFETESEYINEKASFEYPQVSLTDDNGKVWVKKKPIYMTMTYMVSDEIPSGGIISNNMDIFKSITINGKKYDTFINKSFTQNQDSFEQIDGEECFKPKNVITEIVKSVTLKTSRELTESDYMFEYGYDKSDDDGYFYIDMISYNDLFEGGYLNKIDETTYELTNDYVSYFNEGIKYNFSLSLGFISGQVQSSRLISTPYCINKESVIETLIEYNSYISLPSENGEYIVKGELKEGVTKLDKSDFCTNFNLKSIIIPKEIESIITYDDDYNTYNDANLDGIFCGCINLINVMFETNSKLKFIGEYTFQHCYKLNNIKIPNGVTEIKYGTFNQCIGLTSFELPNTITIIDENAFYDCYTLTSITIPNSVTTIKYGAFYACNLLDYIIIPSSITSIEKDVFRHCFILKDNFINNSVLNAESNNYWGCGIIDTIINNELFVKDNSIIGVKPNIETVIIPNYITSINDAFSNCELLKNISFEENSQLKMISDSAFQFCKLLENIIIPEGVTSIGYCSFYYCSGLTSVTIPSSVTSINSSAFVGCTMAKNNFINNSLLDAESNDYWGATVYDTLTDNGLYIRNNNIIKCVTTESNITIPEGVTSIGKNAFSSCYSLTSITIPNSVTSIGYGAFNYCTKLNEIICNAIIAPSIDRSFYGIKKNGVLKVPQGSDYSSWMSDGDFNLNKYNWTIEYI